MNTSLFVLSTIVAFAGQYSQGRLLEMQFLIAVIFLAILLSVIASVDARLANMLLGLILVTASLEYGGDILRGLNLA